MIKAVFFDVDGTLLSHKTKQIPPGAKSSLEKLRKSGVKIFLSTGRHLTELEELPVNELEFDGYITLNGQLCLDGTGQKLSGMPFDRRTAEELVSMFNKKEMPVALVEEERIYINFVNESVLQAQAAVSTPAPAPGEYAGKAVYQATVFLRQEEEQKLEGKLPKGCRFLRWNDRGLDIVPDAGGKMRGIQYFQKLSGFSREEIMAFGDADNDLDMLAYAGVGVAMGDAKETVKRAADYVTEEADAEGIEKALFHFGLFIF